MGLTGTFGSKEALHTNDDDDPPSTSFRLPFPFPLRQLPSGPSQHLGTEDELARQHSRQLATCFLDASMANVKSGGRVAVVGGGIAGIVSAKECRAAGLQVVGFEADKALGGLWNPVRGHAVPIDLVAFACDLAGDDGRTPRGTRQPPPG